ncbi:hypothetical protein KFK09_028676 [Dendrobium nobile]|uniref:Uncharacterized protein n=1 Tax=Dendrobium nobile TaxID=94219 RepID=A0A8T3A3R3_DENNO|nr:hypothetical protein KFK09_028676 [Dendrobium nobile]
MALIFFLEDFYKVPVILRVSLLKDGAISPPFTPYICSPFSLHLFPDTRSLSISPASAIGKKAKVESPVPRQILSTDC